MAAGSCAGTPNTLQGPKCSWLQTTAALLSLQLGWGLWLFPAAYARLGWVPGIAVTLSMAMASVYSGSLFTRLYMAVPDAVLLGDIGKEARGRVGRTIVYVIIYSLDATRCIILHLAATQSLRHALGDAAPPQWRCGLVVLLLAGLLSQIRALSQLSYVFLTGTLSQLVAICIVMYDMIRQPDPGAVTQLVGDSSEHGTFQEAFVAAFSIVFAFGGQFAFCELLADMKAPALFPRAIAVCTSMMAPLYIVVGAVGYWSRGMKVTDIVIFSLGDSLQARMAAGLILLQALSQYLVNLNVWSHNLLVLVARTYRVAQSDNKPGPAAAAPLAQSATARSAAEHQPLHWLAATGFVVSYSWLVSMWIPYFSCMVGIVSSSTYLVCAYTLPCWFALKLLRSSMQGAEVVLCYVLMGVSLPLSALGLTSSVTSLVRNMGCKRCSFEPWAVQAVFLLWLCIMLNAIGLRCKRYSAREQQKHHRQCWMPLISKQERDSLASSSNSSSSSS